jgi:hypothetical protein
MALRPGELTDRIEAAFEAEWQRTKSIPLPAAGGEDRRLLFAAVARGVLGYLKDHEDELFRTITLRDVGEDKAWTVTDANLDIERT